jgi:hypothetical protein
MFHFTAPPPLTLYIHLPWCVRKCPYCDFNSHEVREAVPEQAYVEALIADLEQDLPLVWGRTVQAIFIGGGTPSLFSPGSIDQLLGACAPAAQARRRDHPGGQSRHGRPGTLPGISGGRRQSPLARHPELPARAARGYRAYSR